MPFARTAPTSNLFASAASATLQPKYAPLSEPSGSLGWSIVTYAADNAPLSRVQRCTRPGWPKPYAPAASVEPRSATCQPNNRLEAGDGSVSMCCRVHDELEAEEE